MEGQEAYFTLTSPHERPTAPLSSHPCPPPARQVHARRTASLHRRSDAAGHPAAVQLLRRRTELGAAARLPGLPGAEEPAWLPVAAGGLILWRRCACWGGWRDPSILALYNA